MQQGAVWDLHNSFNRYNACVYNAQGQWCKTVILTLHTNYNTEYMIWCIQAGDVNATIKGPGVQARDLVLGVTYKPGI